MNISLGAPHKLCPEFSAIWSWHSYEQFQNVGKGLLDVLLHPRRQLRIAGLPAGEARRILRRIDFDDTPKHASWLNMVKIKSGVLQQQCLSLRAASCSSSVSTGVSRTGKRLKPGSRPGSGRETTATPGSTVCLQPKGPGTRWRKPTPNPVDPKRNPESQNHRDEVLNCAHSRRNCSPCCEDFLIRSDHRRPADFTDGVAERQGFEPWRRVTAYTRSRRAPSTTRPPLPTASLLSILLQLQGPSNNGNCPPGCCGIRATGKTSGLDSQIMHSNIAGTNSTATRTMPSTHPGH